MTRYFMTIHEACQLIYDLVSEMQNNTGRVMPDNVVSLDKSKTI